MLSNTELSSIFNSDYGYGYKISSDFFKSHEINSFEQLNLEISSKSISGTTLPELKDNLFNAITGQIKLNVGEFKYVGNQNGLSAYYKIVDDSIGIYSCTADELTLSAKFKVDDWNDLSSAIFVTDKLIENSDDEGLDCNGTYVIDAITSGEYKVFTTFGNLQSEIVRAQQIDKNTSFDKIYYLSSETTTITSDVEGFSLSDVFVECQDETPDKFNLWKNGILSSVTRKGDNVFTIPNVIKFDEDTGKAYISNDDSRAELTYNGFVFDKSLFDKDIKAISYTYDKQSKKFTANYNSKNSIEDLNIEGDNDIAFYYDENCSVLVELDPNEIKTAGLMTGKRSFLAHTSDGQRISSEDDEQNTVYEKLLDYKYQSITSYKNRKFIDWFNADTRINYNRINDVYVQSGTIVNRPNQFFLTVKKDKTPVAVSSLVFDDMSMTITKNTEDMNYIQLSSTYEPVTFNLKIGPDSENIDNIKLGSENYTLSSLLVGNSQSTRAESMLSFNFNISEDGWTQFNDEMYKQNPNYMKVVDLGDVLLSSDVLKKAKNVLGMAEFNGIFIANLRVFNSNFNDDSYDSTGKGFVKYKTYTYKTNWIAKIKTRRGRDQKHELILTVTSGNDSLQFSTFLICENKDSDNKYEGDIYKGTVELNGFLFTINIDGLDHHIQIPQLKIYCEFDKDNGKLFMSFKYKETGKTYKHLNADPYNNILNYDIMTQNSKEMLSAFTSTANWYSYDKNKKEIDSLIKKINNEFGSADTTQITNANLETYQRIKKYDDELKSLLGDSFNVSLSTTLSNDASNVPCYANVDAFVSEFNSHVLSGNSFKGKSNPVLRKENVKLFSKKTDKVLIQTEGNGSCATKFETGEILGYFAIYRHDVAYRIDNDNKSKSISCGPSDPLKKYFNYGNDKYTTNSNCKATPNTGLNDIDFSYYPSGVLLNDLNAFFGSNNSIKIGNTIYSLEKFGSTNKMPGTFSWRHCGNTRFKHDCIVFTLSEGISFTYNIDRTDLNLPVSGSEWPYFNILPILDEDPHTHYFLNWMTINDLRFTQVGNNNDKNLSSKGVLSGLPSLSSWVATSSYFEDVNEQSKYCSFNDSLSGTKKLTSEFYDIEQFVKPFDMSTNLIYYKGGNDDNLENNDIFILNAKKMYTDIDYLDKKPKNTAISLDMSSLANKEITLTGIINVASDKAFTEIYPYVNDQFEYTYSDNANDETLQSANFRRVRYTDYRNKAYQWRLFKTNSSVTFSTTDDFECGFIPRLSMTSAVTFNDDEKIKMPCKMSIKFKDLIFQQKMREGIQFDDISSIDFEDKIFGGDIFNASMSGDFPGYAVRYLTSDYTDEEGIIYREINVADDMNPDVLSNLSAYSSNPIGYIVALTSYTEIQSIGSDNYNLDLMNLNAISNSVNKWKTTYSSKKYSDLFVYSDYNPKGDNCIGTPYTNLDDKIMLEVEYPEGTIGGGSGILRSATYIAERVKIATDKKYINNIRGYDELDASQHRFDRNDVVTLTNPKCNTISKNGDNYNITFEISGVITDPKTYGYELIELPLSGSASEQSFESIQENSNLKHDSIWIFFDGLNINSKKEVLLNENDLKYLINKKKYKISQVLSSNIILDESTITGSFTLEFIDADSIENEMIEIHNIKLPEPKIKSIKIDYNDRTKDYLTKDGLLKVDDDVWAKYIMLNKSELSYDLDESPVFLFQDSDKIKSNCVELYDNNNNLTGLFVTLKVNGFRKFEKAGFNWKFANPTEVLLSSQEMVDDYKSIGYALTSGVVPSSEMSDLLKIFPEYRNDVALGNTVISGDYIGNEFNSIKTVPITGNIQSVGECLYKVNPPENNKFQLELLVKPSGKEDFEKYIYYVNKPVGRWYNLSLYKYQDKSKNNAGSDYEDLINYGLTLTDVTGESIYDITEKSNEIFNCFVINDSMTKGDKIESSVDADTLSSLIRNGMYKYDAMYDIKFDPCSRYPFNLNFTTDSSVLKYQGIEITETEYNKKDRRNKDLFSISKDITRILNKNNFAKSDVTINLFDNKGVSQIISSNLIDFNFNESKPIDYNYNDLSGRYDSFTTSALIRYTPRRVFLDDSDEYYVLSKKSNVHHMSPVPGMKVKSVMWIASPDFSDDGEVGYAENENDSILMLKEFKNLFDNPQYKLPPVHYSQKILNSDYSTLVYNSCKSLSAVQIDSGKLDLSDSKYVLDYSKNPTIIAYVWDNSQVSRNETKSKNEAPRLQYSRILSDYEYIAEVGSIYNYEDRQNTTNIVLVEASTPIERQTALMPVMTTPFTLEKLSNESAYVKVTDDIIATAALGYSDVGYARNAVMKFVKETTNRDVKIDTTQTTYLYLAQNDKSNNCSFGSTQEKPVYVDTVSQNYASLAETYDLMPQLYPSNLSPEYRDPLFRGYFKSSNTTDSFNMTINSNGDEYVYDYRKQSFTQFETPLRIEINMNSDVTENCSSVFITDEIWNKFKDNNEHREKLYKSEPVFSFNGEKIENNDINYPQIELKWTNKISELTGSLKYSTFKNDISRDVSNENVYLTDIYGSKNVSTIEFGFKKEHIQNAPILIGIEFLVAKEESEGSDNIVLNWKHADEYDFNIVDSYKDEFDLIKVQKNIIKQFTPLPGDKNEYPKHCFGIRLTIKQIVPQINEKNEAIIDYIKISVSDITNKCGNSIGINDVYVRKCDANCRNYYNMDVSEYVWRLPNSISEWNTVLSTLQNDVDGPCKFIDKDHWTLINVSGVFKNEVTSETYQNALISGQLSSVDFSFMNAFYITNDVAGRSIKEVLSDSYLIDSNMKVTWKYVDYVYISYSCYGGNSRILLEKYFGDKILKAVKSKLINNIESMNANSAFKDRFEFSGGIMVGKEESINVDQHTDVFKWNTSHQIERNWSKVYTKTTTEIEKATPQPIYEITVSTVTDTYRNKKYSGSTVNSSYKYTEGASKITKQTLTSTEVNDRLDREKDHYGAAIENAKYSSVDSWLNSIQPIMLKYKIN